MTIIVAALYKFVRLPDFAEKQHPLLSLCREQGVKGTILLALEGINGTIAGSPDSINSVLCFYVPILVWQIWNTKSLMLILHHLTV